MKFQGLRVEKLIATTVMRKVESESWIADELWLRGIFAVEVSGDCVKRLMHITHQMNQNAKCLDLRVAV